MKSPADAWVPVVSAEVERLTHFLRSLSDAAWDQPTACDRWSVRDIVAHLAGAASAFAQRITQGVQGQTKRPMGLPDAGAVNASSWAAPNAQRWLDISAEMGLETLVTFETTNAEFHEVISQLSPGDWEALCYHPGGLITVQTMVGLRLLELVVHGWDIRSALAAESALASEPLPLLVHFFAAYLDWFFIPAEHLGQPLRYRVDFSDPAIKAHDIVVVGDTAYMEPAGSIAPDVTFLSQAETFVLLMCGRYSLLSCLDDGRIRLQGERELALAFSTWFQGA